MKRLFLIAAFLVCTALSSLAQPPKAMNSKQKQWKGPYDSLDMLKRTKPFKATHDKYANQEVSYKAKRTKPVAQTKLDDLKNPFDTGKVKTARTIK